MNNYSEIKTIFLLRKKDIQDFDREDVSYNIGLVPSESVPPTISKGRINSDECDEDCGITPICQGQPPYKYILHAYVTYEFCERNVDFVEAALTNLAELLNNKTHIIKDMCKKYNLNPHTIIKLYTDTDMLLGMGLSRRMISLFDDVGSDVTFEVQIEERSEI